MPKWPSANASRYPVTAAVAAYREGFALSHYGLGSAVAVVLILILLAFSIIYVRLIGKEGEL